MRGQNEKTIKEMEMEIAELITKLGQCEQDIFADSNKYRAVKKQINNPGTLHEMRTYRR
jgi:hypothetical protein